MVEAAWDVVEILPTLTSFEKFIKEAVARLEEGAPSNAATKRLQPTLDTCYNAMLRNHPVELMFISPSCTHRAGHDLGLPAAPA